MQNYIYMLYIFNIFMQNYITKNSDIFRIFVCAVKLEEVVKKTYRSNIWKLEKLKEIVKSIFKY